MATTTSTFAPSAAAHSASIASADRVPWTIWCMITGLVCGTVGGHWDISWHMSIGRDTFWTPRTF